MQLHCFNSWHDRDNLDDCMWERCASYCAQSKKHQRLLWKARLHHWIVQWHDSMKLVPVEKEGSYCQQSRSYSHKCTHLYICPPSSVPNNLVSWHFEPSHPHRVISGLRSAQLVSWCFEPSHPHRAISGLRSAQLVGALSPVNHIGLYLG